MAVPAAQYVRMSTGDQQFSIASQETAILAYADRNNFSIVRTYSDPGRSGVTIQRRQGLRGLLQDVIGGNAEYRAILVYDVSRWGRFQNPDEAAHYEYLCENAGIPVHYCCEQFPNDGTMPSSLMKALKRTMAAEYSRELSAKVFQGQKHFAELGFRVGGKDLYGLRRLLVTRSGQRRHILKPGERKSVTTDHVILIPGPKHEVDCIRRIFHAASEGKSPSQIAQELRHANVKFVGGREWDKDGVWRTLRHPQYAGYNVWARSTQKIKSKKRFMPRSEWILKPKAFVPLVDQETFAKVQRLLTKRRTWPGKTDETIVNELRALLAKKGTLSHKIMMRARGLYNPRTYYDRYGSYLKLYEMVGFKMPEMRALSYRRSRNARLLLNTVFDTLREMFGDHIQVFRSSRIARKMLKIDGQWIVSVFLCRQFSTPTGLRRWMLKVPRSEHQNIALLCLADLDSCKISGFNVVPPVGQSVGKRKQFGNGSEWLMRGRKLRYLSEFYDAILTCTNGL